MKSGYYYDNPFEAMYMVKTYKIDIVRESTISMTKKYGRFYTFKQLASHIANPDNRKECYHVDLSSVDVFQPQLQDVGLDGASRICKWVGNKWIVLDAPRHESEPVCPVQIISRGQLNVFFPPKYNIGYYVK